MTVYTKIKIAQRGFSLIELMVVIAVIAIVAAVTAPALLNWRPNQRLRRAAKDLYSNMQLCKIEAIKTSQNITINFVSPNSYNFTLNGQTRTIDLTQYGSGVRFGIGSATGPGPTDCLGLPPSGINYGGNQLTFNNRGMITGTGYVFLQNDDGACFAVGTPNLGGVVFMRKNFNSTLWQ